MVNVTSQLNKAKEDVATLSRKQELVREEIANLEVESKDLTKKLVEAWKT